MGWPEDERGGAKDVKQDARVEKEGGRGSSEKLGTSCDGNKSSVLPCTSFRVSCTRIYPLQPSSTTSLVPATRRDPNETSSSLLDQSMRVSACQTSFFTHPPLHPSIFVRLPLRRRKRVAFSLSLSLRFLLTPR